MTKTKTNRQGLMGSSILLIVAVFCGTAQSTADSGAAPTVSSGAIDLTAEQTALEDLISSAANSEMLPEESQMADAQSDQANMHSLINNLKEITSLVEAIMATLPEGGRANKLAEVFVLARSIVAKLPSENRTKVLQEIANFITSTIDTLPAHERANKLSQVLALTSSMIPGNATPQPTQEPTAEVSAQDIPNTNQLSSVADSGLSEPSAQVKQFPEVKAKNLREFLTRPENPIYYSEINTEDGVVEGNCVLRRCNLGSALSVKGKLYITESDPKAPLSCENEAKIYRAKCFGSITVRQTGDRPAEVYIYEADMNADIIFPDNNGIVYIKSSYMRGKVIGGTIVRVDENENTDSDHDISADSDYTHSEHIQSHVKNMVNGLVGNLNAKLTGTTSKYMKRFRNSKYMKKFDKNTQVIEHIHDSSYGTLFHHNTFFAHCTFPNYIKVKGEVGFEYCTLNNGGVSSENKAYLNYSTVNGNIVVKQTGDKPAEVHLDNATVNGDIIFPNSNGIVYRDNSTLNGKIIGGKIAGSRAGGDDNDSYEDSHNMQSSVKSATNNLAKKLSSKVNGLADHVKKFNHTTRIENIHDSSFSRVLDGNSFVSNCNIPHYIEVKGEVGFNNCTLSNGGFSCENKADLNNARVHGNIVVKQTGDKPAEVHLDNATVHGDIIFPNSNGIVYKNNARIKGKIIGGHVRGRKSR